MEQTHTRPLLIAFVGMPGAGKTEAVQYITQKKNVPFVRFGDLTDEGLRQQQLPLTPENERTFRETFRKTHGMAAYAIYSKERIDTLLTTHSCIVLDGLYSWEEYTYLQNLYEGLTIIHVYAEPKIRYQRLTHRTVRPLTEEEARKRDFVEIEKLNKGGPIAIADYCLDNNGDTKELYNKIDTVLSRLEIT